MAIPPKPKSIPDSVYTEKIIKIADEEVLTINESINIVRQKYNTFFILYRFFENLTVSLLTLAIVLYDLGTNYYLVFGTILSFIVSQIFKNASETYIEVLLLLNIKKETMIYEKAFHEFANNN